MAAKVLFLGIRDEDSAAAEVVPITFSDVTDGTTSWAVGHRRDIAGS